MTANICQFCFDLMQEKKVVDPPAQGAADTKKVAKEGVKKPSNYVIFSQIFSLIFLGELGDRSQLYTIALSSRNPPILVFCGAYMVIFRHPNISLSNFQAHMFAIVVAIIFGRYIASRINEKWLILAAGILYFGLGISMYFE